MKPGEDLKEDGDIEVQEKIPRELGEGGRLEEGVFGCEGTPPGEYLTGGQ